MSMDVIGHAPRSDVGRFFHLSIHWWHPLWSYVEEISAVVPSENLGHFNEQWGLSDEDAKELAKELRLEIVTGRAKRHELQAILVPDPHGDAMRGFLSNQIGLNFDIQDDICFSEETVAKFAAFLEASGGFEIW